MAAVYWALQHVSDVPPSDDWLSASEREVLARLWAPKRRRDWRLGRWTAKRVLVRAGLAGMTGLDPRGWTRISILATEAGVPRARVDETDADWVVSLSHSGEYGLCAVAERPGLVGCDIETIGRRGEEFVINWFTDAERAFVESIPAAEERSQMVMLVWSAKESALKALGVGLRLDTRQVRVELIDNHEHRWPTSDARSESAAWSERDSGWSGVGVPFSPGAVADWSPLLVRAPDRPLHGWWRADGERVMTIVAEPAPAAPLSL
jgi:4'-phosphopantetheinyl transferase